MFRSLPRRLTWLALALGGLALLPATGVLKAQTPGGQFQGFGSPFQGFGGNFQSFSGFNRNQFQGFQGKQFGFSGGTGY